MEQEKLRKWHRLRMRQEQKKRKEKRLWKNIPLNAPKNSDWHMGGKQDKDTDPAKKRDIEKSDEELHRISKNFVYQSRHNERANKTEDGYVPFNTLNAKKSVRRSRYRD